MQCLGKKDQPARDVSGGGDDRKEYELEEHSDKNNVEWRERENAPRLYFRTILSEIRPGSCPAVRLEAVTLRPC